MGAFFDTYLVMYMVFCVVAFGLSYILMDIAGSAVKSLTTKVDEKKKKDRKTNFH